MIRMEANRLQLWTVEWSNLGPDALRHAHGSEVVDLAGQPDEGQLGGLKSEAFTRVCCERAHSTRVPERER